MIASPRKSRIIKSSNNTIRRSSNNNNNNGNSNSNKWNYPWLVAMTIWLLGIAAGSWLTVHVYSLQLLTVAVPPLDNSHRMRVVPTNTNRMPPIPSLPTVFPPTMTTSRSSDNSEQLIAAKETIEQLRAQLLQQQQSSSSSTPKDDIPHSPTCRKLFSSFGSSSGTTTTTTTTIPSALAVWNHWLPHIHTASQLRPNDAAYAFHDFTAQLLRYATPRLPNSVGHVPAFVTSSSSTSSNGNDNTHIDTPQDDTSQWSAVRRVLDTVVARWDYVQQQQQQHVSSPDATTPPPPVVKMVILGGSVLVGRNCRKLVKDLGLQMRMPQRECTYSHRLERLVHELWTALIVREGHKNANSNNKHSNKRGKKPSKADTEFVLPVLEVTRVAMGGTNTATGSRILEFDLIPPEAQNPDIVLNAYSTNDMHVLTMLEAQSGNQTLQSKLLEMTQDFVRTVLQRRPCGHAPPLLLHLDDYLGNEQREITATMELSQSVSTLAQYYGFTTLSYANMVRRTVYGDTHESWLSPEGWWPTASSKEMEREIHPGMGMHILSSWVVAYNLLNLATTYCSMEPFHTDQKLQYNESHMAQRIPPKNRLTDVPGKPKEPPRGLPPLLSSKLRLDNITELWRDATATEDEALEAVYCRIKGASYTPATKCIFSWVSGLSLQQNNKTWIEELFGAHRTEPTKWSLQDDGGKLGFVPYTVRDSTVLEFPRLPQPIGAITFFTLRSYGPKWADSLLRVETAVQKETGDEWNDVAVNSFVGFHAKNTSELYTEEIILADPVPIGGALRLRYTLMDGTSFKIMGLAVCT